MEPASVTVEIAQYMKPALAVITGLLGWLVKDYFFGILSRRREVVRAEWKSRLTELWGPLFYWSGVLRMRDDKKGWDRHGVKELEELIKRNVHLIPQRHFYTLIRLVEYSTGQSTPPLDERAYSQARQFIYQRIEILNFLLYRQTREYDPDAYTDPLAVPRRLWRGTTLVFVHAIVWALVLAVPGAIYLAWTRHLRWVLWVTGGPLILGAAVELRRRIAVHRSVTRALYPDQSWTWKALCARVMRAVWSPQTNSGVGTPRPSANPTRDRVVGTVHVGRVAKAHGENARTVAEVWAQRAELNGKPITVRGNVVKFTDAIMDRNWIHLRDGTGAPGKDNDLTVTTNDRATVGATVVVKGTVRVDKDFGAGYAYPVIVEDAKIGRSK